MQYSEGSIGRVFVLKMDHGEDMLESIQRFAEEKVIKAGFMLLMGALKDGRAVTGPERPVIPPDPHFEDFEGAWEVFGMATIYPSPGGSGIHLHSSMGRGREGLVGCIRENASVYLIVEAVLIELAGIKASRDLDTHTGLHLLSLANLL